jgi:hypothetical protein
VVSNAYTVALFGTFNGNDRVNTRVMSWSLGKPLRVRASYGGPGVDIAAAGAVDESAWAESRWEIEIRDTPVDGVSDRVALLAAALRDLSTITVGMPGSDHVGTLIPKNAECVERPITAISPVTFTETVEVIVQRDQWVYAPEQTIINASATALPAVLDISSMNGTAPAPVNLLAAAGAYPDETATIDLFVREAVDFSWSAGAATTGADGWPDGAGNTYWQSNTLAPVYADIDVTDFEHGEYHVFCRGKENNAAGSCYVKQAFGDYVEIVGTSPRLYHLGVVTLPTSGVYGAAASLLRVYLMGDDTYYAMANTFVFIPANFGGMVGWKADTGHVHELRFENDVVYRDAYGDIGNAFGERRIKTLGGAIVAIAETVTSTPTTTATLTVYADPRYEQLP